MVRPKLNCEILGGIARGMAIEGSRTGMGARDAGRNLVRRDEDLVEL